ncbi:MAG TPA: hypothetical protein VD816_10555 [Ohtaekwangia sp.]|nr:hypothetical protein [Ohtaekwangia sp.]
MTNLAYIICVAAVFVFSAIYLFSGNFFYKLFKAQPDNVSYESARDALDRISSWTIWITGIQTAAMGAMGFLAQEENINDFIVYGFFALLFFGASITLSTWLLSSLPSIQQRLKLQVSTENDIYMIRIFSVIPISMGRFTGLVHAYFLIGIVFFALFIFQTFENGTPGNCSI